jgi:hypothetical protein
MAISTNKDPIFTKSGIFNFGKTIITQNTAKDGTGTVVTVYDPQRAISTLTSASTTATVTTTDPHGFLNGESILISGAVEAGYNGVQVITLTGPKTFTYSVAPALSTPATGTIVADPINGSRVQKIVFQPTGTAVATAARAFLNNGQTNVTATNNTYLDTVTLAAATLSEVADMPSTEMNLDIVVPPFCKINVTIGTTVAAAYHVYAVAGGY